MCRYSIEGPRSRLPGGPILLWLTIVAWTGAERGYAFRDLEVGEPLPNVELKTLDGIREPLLGSSSANVFVFVRPDQEHSRQALHGLVELAARMARPEISWSIVVSDSWPRGSIEAMDAPGRVLIDEADRLYGALGVSLHPVIGIADRDGLLQAYVPFRKVNLTAVVEAHLLRLLGEITEEQLQARLGPERVGSADPAAAAHRQLAMAEKLYERQKLVSARRAVEKSLEIAPDLDEALALLAVLLATEGDCGAAGETLGQAEGLPQDEPRRDEVQRICGDP